jgi:dihydroorotase
VDAIATDHAPHTPADKAAGANGISGIEHAFASVNTALVKSGEISLNCLSRLMSKNPADIMGLKKGRLQAGFDADFVLLDPDKKITVKAAEMLSRGKNTPLDGRELFGEIIATVRKGKITYAK